MGELGDLAGLPHPPPPRAECRPQHGVAVAQVDRVPHQRLGREWADAHHQAQLRAGELHDQRGARTPDPDRPLHPHPHRPHPVTRVVGVVGGWGRVQVGPVRGQRELAPLLLPQPGLGRGHRLARRLGVQVSDPTGVEHVFDSTLARGQSRRENAVVHKGNLAIRASESGETKTTSGRHPAPDRDKHKRPLDGARATTRRSASDHSTVRERPLDGARATTQSGASVAAGDNTMHPKDCAELDAHGQLTGSPRADPARARTRRARAEPAALRQPSLSASTLRMSLKVFDGRITVSAFCTSGRK